MKRGREELKQEILEELRKELRHDQKKMKKEKKKEKQKSPKQIERKQRNHIYSDGNCHGNGKKGAKAGVGVTGILASSSSQDVTNDISFAVGLKLPGVSQTNNRAELLGLFLAMLAADETMEVTITTDSEYAIKTTTGEWEAKSNLDLVDSCRAMLQRRPLVKFRWTKGHANNEGNCEADQLATQAILS
jgi:ribonuclease HI